MVGAVDQGRDAHDWGRAGASGRGSEVAPECRGRPPLRCLKARQLQYGPEPRHLNTRRGRRGRTHSGLWQEQKTDEFPWFLLRKSLTYRHFAGKTCSDNMDGISHWHLNSCVGSFYPTVPKPVNPASANFATRICSVSCFNFTFCVYRSEHWRAGLKILNGIRSYLVQSLNLRSLQMHGTTHMAKIHCCCTNACLEERSRK